MKARVKATGEIFDIEGVSLRLTGKVLSTFWLDDVEVLTSDQTPDYWTRLEHQYAGMAMQGMLSNDVIMNNIREVKEETMAYIITNFATNLAHALVEKLKKEEEK